MECPDSETPLPTEGIQVTARFSNKTSNLIDLFHFPVLYIGRVANDDVKASFGHDAVELGEPVERLVAGQPLVVVWLVGVDAVFRGEVAVEFARQSVKPVTQFLLGGRELAAVHALLGL